MEIINPSDNGISLNELANGILNEVQNSNSLLRVKTLRQNIEEARLRPDPKKLIGSLMYQNEICIGFSETGGGKTIFAVEKGHDISAGNGGEFGSEAPAQKVLYLNFELSDKQLQLRCSDDSGCFPFNENFLHADIDPDCDIPEYFKNNFEAFLNHSIEEALITTGAKVVIVDNITYLRDETEKAKAALPLMKQLKGLQRKHGLSMLVLAHTPKRDSSKPLGVNDLQGSKMLINFCDSAFAIGESQLDKNLRYIKQIKVRNGEFMYGSENVAVFEIAKPGNLVHFMFKAFTPEREHLKHYTEKDRTENIEKVKELHSQNYTQRQIAEKVGISSATVNKYIKQHINKTP